MFAVIFEVQPRQDRFDDYLSLAKLLKPELEKIDGFIDNERFGSKRADGLLLSLSTWRDEKALVRWRTLGRHHEAQEKGRSEIFADYHLRVGEIVVDTQIPQDQKRQELRRDETEIGKAKVVTISEFLPTKGEEPANADRVAGLSSALGLVKSGVDGVVDQEVFESITNPGKLLLLVGWRDAAAASYWAPKTIVGGTLRHRNVRIIRDYGMADRREAPQYYAEVKR
ncbi:MAG: antibiotic biosynthesis monooxygenase family protein [Methylovirgula sp.]